MTHNLSCFGIWGAAFGDGANFMVSLTLQSGNNCYSERRHRILQRGDSNEDGTGSLGFAPFDGRWGQVGNCLDLAGYSYWLRNMIHITQRMVTMWRK